MKASLLKSHSSSTEPAHPAFAPAAAAAAAAAAVWRICILWCPNENRLHPSYTLEPAQAASLPMSKAHLHCPYPQRVHHVARGRRWLKTLYSI